MWFAPWIGLWHSLAGLAVVGVVLAAPAAYAGGALCLANSSLSEAVPETSAPNSSPTYDLTLLSPRLILIFVSLLVCG